MAKEYVYIVQREDFAHHTEKTGRLHLIEAHSTIESANAGAKAHFTKESAKAVDGDPDIQEHQSKDGGFQGQCWTRQDRRDSYTVEVKKMELKSGAAAAKQGKATASKKSKAQAEAEDDEDDDVEDEKPAPAKKAAAKKAGPSKDEIPEGMPGALHGLRVLFTGTFEKMDRKASEAAAEKYGATIVRKLEDTDYVIVGVRAGTKKLDEIEEKGLETVDEEGFYELLQSGVPQEKRKRMAEKAEAEPQKKKQKK